MKTDHQKRVEEFMRLAKQEVPQKPTIPDEKVRLLRARLIFEECMETIQALGVSVNLLDSFNICGHKKDDFSFQADGICNIEEVAKEICDVSVVSIGTLSAFGLSDGVLLEAVDQNNLEKFGEGHSWDNFGKLIKPPNFQKLDLKPLLDAQSRFISVENE
jgi:predicted HAD superfamily Cof-like phosphohydrolase